MKLLALLLSFALLAGCATSSNVSLVYQWGTMKLIENGKVTPEQVIAGVDTIRTLGAQNTSFTYGAFIETVKQAVSFDTLQPSDRLVIQSLLRDTQLDLGLSSDSLLSNEHREGIAQRLTWIQEAAMLSGG